MSRHTRTAATRRLLAVSALAGALALSATACSSGTDGGVDKPRTSASAGGDAEGNAAQPAGDGEAKAADAPTEQGGPRTPRTTAVATAERAVPGGKVTDVELEDGVWEIDVMTSGSGGPRVHNIDVDATTGALLGSRADRMPDKARSYLKIPLAKLAAATVHRDDAANTALKEAGAGFVSELSIQGTESRPLWQIEVTDGTVRHEIDVDTKTGEVVGHDKDTDGEDERSGRGEGGGDGDRSDGDSGSSSSSSSSSYEEIKERSDDFGKEHYDWSQHVR
ncbi:PepSY domain-containing protein [Streptomyces sp. TRM66268-LWL]|uniref:PepSY domain-containing protein n=1 Tax=Streptomyces polyasparticus TaxID=2767826 RepID=A0ABR7SEQ5_9ACTN|nr:PepSY domain-containing protein [Streptomyces polyasparticus]MBC9713986.1 PepSY domain-containing protein [Streptomyces polyasparticus]